METKKQIKNFSKMTNKEQKKIIYKKLVEMTKKWGKTEEF